MRHAPFVIRSVSGASLGSGLAIVREFGIRVRCPRCNQQTALAWRYGALGPFGKNPQNFLSCRNRSCKNHGRVTAATMRALLNEAFPGAGDEHPATAGPAAGGWETLPMGRGRRDR